MKSGVSRGTLRHSANGKDSPGHSSAADFCLPILFVTADNADKVSDRQQQQHTGARAHAGLGPVLNGYATLCASSDKDIGQAEIPFSGAKVSASGAREFQDSPGQPVVREKKSARALPLHRTVMSRHCACAARVNGKRCPGGAEE
ncbi:hypothetical protein ZHAS_00004344 [Anopheles sinensis]|uniref:Uncharacterized protein n=1 Tax=Anopheles sinensis TaxID=74873 RepID=A0A084VGN7_ANOSI|nr:hypothetical protein ZHAS_00004344 [Anopheles sinensis]